MFSHLLENAVDALRTLSPESHREETPTKITITTYPNAETVVITISDNGPGIASTIESKAQLFDPFFTTKPLGQGTGLGLAICYSIMQQHHGRINYQSAPGIGTTFTLELSVSQSASPRLSQDF